MMGIRNDGEYIEARWARSTTCGLEVQRVPIMLVKSHCGWMGCAHVGCSLRGGAKGCVTWFVCSV